MTETNPLAKAIQIVGSYEKLGKALKPTDPKGLTKGAVWQWTLPGRKVPAEYCPEIERLTGGQVRCEELRPDVNWAFLRAKPRKAKA